MANIARYQARMTLIGDLYRHRKITVHEYTLQKEEAAAQHQAYIATVPPEFLPEYMQRR